MMMCADHDVEMWFPAAVLGEIVDDLLHRFRYRPRLSVRVHTAVDEHPPRRAAPPNRDPERVSETHVVHPYFDVIGGHHHPP